MNLLYKMQAGGAPGQSPDPQINVPTASTGVEDNTGNTAIPNRPNILFNNGLGNTNGGEIDPVKAAIIKSNQIKSNPLTKPKYTNLNDTTERYLTDNYGGYNPDDAGVEDWYGEHQNPFKQWGNRLVKFGVKSLGSFGAQLMDIPNMLTAVSEGDRSKLWDNPVNNVANDLMKWGEKTFPNYETNWEREHPFLNYLPFIGHSGNSWGKAVENVGFTVGAIGGAIVEDMGVAIVTGGVGEIPLAAMQINKAIYKLGKLIGKGDDAMEALKATIRNSDDIVKGLKGIDRFNHVAREGVWGANMITSGFAEASFEALESANTVRDDLQKQFFDENGRTPNYEESQKIQASSTNAANTRFALNAALLAATNTIQWGSLLRPLSVTKELIEAEVKSGAKIALKEGSLDVFEAIYPTSKAARLGTSLRNNKLVNIIKESLPESFEEGSQFWIQSGVDDYYKRKYNEPAISSIHNFMRAFGSGLSKTLGTQEGWENIVGGLLGGALYKGGEHIYHAAHGVSTPNYNQKLSEVIKGLNDVSLTGIFENKYGEAVATKAIENDLFNAAKTSNAFLFNNYKHEHFVNFVLSGIKQNKYDTRINQLDDLAKLSQTEFQKTFGLPFTEENQGLAANYVNVLKDNAKFIKDISDRVDRTFINPYKYKGTGRGVNEEDLETNEKHIAYENTKGQLIYSMSINKNSQDRINSIKDSMDHDFVNKDEVVMLSSTEGVKQLKKIYSERVKLDQQSYDLTKDASTLKSVKNYEKRLSLINTFLNNNDNKAYNDLLRTVFNGYNEEAADFTNQPFQPFPDVTRAEFINKGKDIFYLNKRSKYAAERYAALTTKDGFKKLFNSELSIREKLAETPIKITPVNTPITPNAEKVAASKSVIDAVDSKEKLSRDELALLGFASIEDINANEKANLKDFIKITSSDGVDMYIEKDIYNTAKGVIKTETPVVTEAPKPPVTPPPMPTDSGDGKSPFRTEDYLDKAFVPPDLKKPFQNAVGGKLASTVLDKMSITISPLEPKYQADYDKWIKDEKGIPKQVDSYPDIYVSKAPLNLSILYDGKEIAKMGWPDRMLFKVNNQFVTLDKITDQQYAQFTGRSAVQYEADLNKYYAIKALKEYLALKFKNNGLQATTISPKELKEVVDIVTTQGSLDIIPYGQERPVFSDLKYNKIKIPIGDGTTFVPSMVIFSSTKTYIADQGLRARTDLIDEIYEEDVFKYNADTSGVTAFKRGRVDQIHALNSRYVGIVQSSSGELRLIAIRPDNLEDYEEIFDSIKERALLSTKNNLKPASASDYDIKIGSEGTVKYYQYSTSEAKSSNDEFNTNLDDVLYITHENEKTLQGVDPVGGINFNLSVSPIGAIRLEIAESHTGNRHTLYIDPQNVNNLSSLKDLTEAFNEEIQKAFNEDPLFASDFYGYKFDIKPSNFKKNIRHKIGEGENERIVSAEEIAPKLSAAVSKDVFKDATMRIVTTPERATAAYVKAGGKREAAKKANVEATPIVSTTAINPRISLLNDIKRELSTLPTSYQNNINTEISRKIVNAFISVDGGQPYTGDLSGLSKALIEANGYYGGELLGLLNMPDKAIEWLTKRIDDAIALANLNTSTFVEAESISRDDMLLNEAINPPTARELNPTIEEKAQIVNEQKSKELANQEDLSSIEFENAKDALDSVNIGFRDDNGVVVYFELNTGEIIPQLTGTFPVDLAKSMNLKIVPKTEDRSYDFMAARATPVTSTIDLQKAKAYLHSILPPFIGVQDLETVLSNIEESGITNARQYVWGAFQNGIIYLNRNAKDIGIEYHEAFHAVFSMLLTEEERTNYLGIAQKELYFELKKEGKSIRDLLKEQREYGVYDDLSDKEAYDRLYEEHMADRFRTWKNLKANDKSSVFSKLFDLIAKFFRWISGNSSTLNALFSNIDNGKYRHSNIATNSYTEEDPDGIQDFSFALIPGRPIIRQYGKGITEIKRPVDPKTSKQVVQTVAAYYLKYRELAQYKDLGDVAILDTILGDLAALYSPDNLKYNARQKEALETSDLSYIYSNEASKEVIKEGAIEYINSINYIEKFREEEEDEEYQDKGKLSSSNFDNTAENIGGFSSLPGLLRQYIGFTSYEKTDSFGNKQLDNGVPIIATIDAVTVYYGLLRAVANITDPVKFFQRMVKYGEGNDQTKHFVAKFVNDIGLDIEALLERNELVVTTNTTLAQLVKNGFNKFRMDYIFTAHDVAKGIVDSYSANRKNVENVQFGSWSNDYLNNYSEYTEDSQKDIRRAIEDLKGKYFDARRSATKFTAQSLSEAAMDFKRSLSNVGMYLSTEYLKYSLLSNKAKLYDAKAEALQKEGIILDFDSAQNTFIDKSDYSFVQIMKIADENTLTSDFLDTLSTILASGNNPYFKTTKKVNKANPATGVMEEVEEEVDSAMIGRILSIAKGNAAFDETVGESSYTNANNQVVFAHQDGTFNIKFSYSLRDANYRKQLREQGYREATSSYRDVYDSEMLTNNALLTSEPFESIADNLIVQRIDGMRAIETNRFGNEITEEFVDKKEGITYGQYSPREFIVNLLNLYVSYSQKQRNNKKGETVTTPHLIRVLEASKTGDAVNLPINDNVYKGNTATSKSVDRLFSELKKEYNRITRVVGEIATLKENIVEKYHTGTYKTDDDGNITTKIKSGYRGLQFTDNITPLLSASTIDKLETQARNGQPVSAEDEIFVKKDILSNLNRIVNDTIQLLDKEGVIKIHPNGVVENIFLDTRYNTGDESLHLSSAKIRDNIGHVIVNDYLNTLAYNQILHGDSALSLKNDGGIDAVKRAKGDNAAIVPMRTELIYPELGITEPFTHSHVAIFREPVSQDGHETKIADAQMYTTVEGLRYTLWGLGRLTPRLANALNRMALGEKVDKEVFDQKDGLLKFDEMTNSIKLVYKDGKTYFKMSVVILQPELTSYKDREGTWKAIPGWETMHNLRTKMESDKITFAAPESASKMATLDVGEDIKGFSDLKAHPYDNSYFGLQTANPSNKKEITTPTQLLQLIDTEQDDSVEVNLQGKVINVGELRDAYQNFVSQKTTNNYESAKNQIYDIKNFNKEVLDSIASGEVTPKLADFQKKAIENLESTGADAQLLDFFSLDENGIPKYNLNMPSTKVKFQQLYLSHFSKGVMSHKSPGNTVSLFSAMDLKILKRATRIVNGKVVEWESIRREAFIKNHNGIQNEAYMPSKASVFIEGQLFLEELEYNVPEYDKNGNPTGNRFSEMLLPPHDHKMLKLNPYEAIPDVISKGVGVRIPSQDKHSFMSLRIVDFLPSNLGSTGIFPKDIVRLSGADFDIDKEYISKYDYYTKKTKYGFSFHKYGEATTDEGKWEEYLDWMVTHNKYVKNYFKTEVVKDERYKRLKEDNIFYEDEDVDNMLDDKLKASIAQDEREIIIGKALQQLKLPSVLSEFISLSKNREYNNGVLNNAILDANVALLTNDGMLEISNTPASLDYLQKIKDDEDLKFNKVAIFGNKSNYPVDSLIGKYNSFKNNTTGKNNIGIDVNSNLIYSALNKGSIKLLDGFGFNFDGHLFNDFAGNNEYNIDSDQYDGKRTNDVLSTLITAATDEAKEQLNATYNFTVDALKIVDYLVSLKVPLDTVTAFVNQPIIAKYLAIKAINANTLKTSVEDQLRTVEFVDNAVSAYKAEMIDKVVTDDEIYKMLEDNKLVVEDCD